VSSEHHCILVTSTAYRKDVLNLLCLPEGIDYRFRYRARWISKELFENPSVLKGMRGTIAYFYGSQADEQSVEFLPIREVVIEDVETLGDILHVRFSTGKFYDQSSWSGGQHPNPLSGPVEAVVAPFLQTSAPRMSRLLVISDFHPLPIGTNQLLSWSSLVQWLSDLKPFQGASFLKTIRLIDSNRTEIQPSVLVSKSGVALRGYKLRGGATYQIELLQRTKDDIRLIEPFEIVMKTPESLIPIKNAAVVGKYDKLELIFSVKPQLDNVYSSVTIQAKGDPTAWIPTKDTGDAKVNVESPEIQLSIKIGRIRHVLPIALITLGIVFAPFASALNRFWVLGLSDLQLSIVSALGVLLVAGGISIFRKVF